MLFLSLLQGLIGKSTEQPSFLKRIRSIEPPSGIKIIGVYALFGRYDGAILFEAPDPKSAMNFVLRIAAPSVYRVETLIAIPAEEL